MATRKGKPLTPEQRELKRARDRRYRAAHKEEINKRAREKTAKAYIDKVLKRQPVLRGGRPEALKGSHAARDNNEMYAAYLRVRGNWRNYSHFLGAVDRAMSLGASEKTVLAMAARQYRMEKRYFGIGRDISSDEGREFFEDEHEDFPDDEWNFYHGALG